MGFGFNLTKEQFIRWLLMFTLSIMITLMVAPELSLVPARYKEGDIIPETIIISDNVTLVDDKSSALRLDQALEDFPPIYDHDTRLKQQVIKALQDTFQSMRDHLAGIRSEMTETENKVRGNSLARLETLAAGNDARKHSAKMSRLKRQVINRIGQLKDMPEQTPETKDELAKQRADLKSIEAQRANLAQELSQLDSKFTELSKDGIKFTEVMQRSKGTETTQMPEMKLLFEKNLGITIEETTFRTFFESQFSSDLEQKTIGVISPFYDLLIVSSLENLDQKRKAIQLQKIDSDKLQRFETLEMLTDVAGVRREINKMGSELVFPGDVEVYRQAVVALAQKLVRPNLTENKGETERRLGELSKNMPPVYFNLKKGDVVARARDQATSQQVEILNALNKYNLANPKYPQIIGTFLIVLLSLLIIQSMIGMQAGNVPPRVSQLLLMSLLLMVTLLAAQGILVLVPALSMVYDFIQPSSFNYLIPAALTSMLAGIVMGFEVAIFLGFVISLSLSIMLGNSLSFFLYSLMGSFIASIPLKRYESRFALWQQGLRISAINVVMLGVLSLLEQTGTSWALAINVAAAALNGLGVTLLTATLLPLIENLFDITTNLKLLELSNMNHPALKELSVRAPGTYHHSIVVGNLSESAAEGIRANPLLVRVASYYHDLGKMLCPLYFVENQQRRNFHDDLPAATSARIIINHIKDGLEIARRFKLGRAIMDIIGQHHGDTVVRYFFHKAQEEMKGLDEEPNIEDFRYPGPKPQTKEAGLVMVADVTEAATRSLSEPSLESIREMVQKLTTRVYMEGQLDESGMTFNDLNFIEKTFTKMLISIHHHRISYPEIKIGPRSLMAPPPALPPPPAEEDEEDPDNLGTSVAAS
ncbi:MAG: HDIG domain-containing protein [Deltaproteobacteria bacterium]|nr:HDIG domain-containing protein [Deltaproteobacteria bacterium]